MGIYYKTIKETVDELSYLVLKIQQIYIYAHTPTHTHTPTHAHRRVAKREASKIDRGLSVIMILRQH